MGNVRCADVLKWLRAAVLLESHAAPLALQAHVGGCATCQAALLLLASAAISIRVPPRAIECADCRADLPGFIEREDEDPVRAIQAFPQIWWHVWTCAVCAETYRMTRVLMQAERHGELALPNVAAILAPQPPQIQVLLRLTRPFLMRALPPPANVMRGHDEGPIVLSERAVGSDRSLRLSVEQQPDQNWTVRVTLTPPLNGWLVLTLGEAVFRACFDAQGTAVVTDMPAILLAGADGPDLTVGLEANSGG